MIDYAHSSLFIDRSLRHFLDRKSTRLNSSHRCNSYAVFCLKKKNLRSVALGAVLAKRGTPSVLGEFQDRFADPGEQIETDQERDVRILRGSAARASGASGVL